jgi:hypothetical protein
VAKKLLEKCLNLIKDHSSLTLTEGKNAILFFLLNILNIDLLNCAEFHMDITDIMLLKQQQKQQQKVQKKTLIHILTAKSEPTVNDVSISDSITYPAVNKSGNGNVSTGQDESAMELAMDSVSS